MYIGFRGRRAISYIIIASIVLSLTAAQVVMAGERDKISAAQAVLKSAEGWNQHVRLEWDEVEMCIRDSLAGVPLAAKNNYLILLVRRDMMLQEVSDYI